MKSQSTKIAIVVLAIVIAAGAFWTLFLSPKREQAAELSKQVSSLRVEVGNEKQAVTEGLAAKRRFPFHYQQLILLGTAVPDEADTASLLVQLNGLSAEAHTPFLSIENREEGEGELPPSAESVSPTESAAALAPLGSSVGPAGFRVMPYELKFTGGYFALANYIQDLDAMVKTKKGRVVSNGRLVTIDGFQLEMPGGNSFIDFNHLSAEFEVSTFVTPPEQGLTAGATASGPAPTTPNLP